MSEGYSIDQCYQHWLSFVFTKEKKIKKELYFSENDVKLCSKWAMLADFFNDPANKQRELVLKIRHYVQEFGLNQCISLLCNIF